ncbi:hypothetical protein [Oleidesulfovibrio sp.]|uniref:hypothetical protein n=1 Tax=Oleidesulfovibrio sp. TaxID=2909707 RepID=UPI003A85A467
MAKYDCEMFGYFSYSPDLSYSELHELEAGFRDALQDALEQRGADFMQFEPEGDALRVQCVFGECHEENFHEVCDAVVQGMNNHVFGKMLFVNKNLQELLVYRLESKGWYEGAIDLQSIQRS